MDKSVSEVSDGIISYLLHFKNSLNFLELFFLSIFWILIHSNRLDKIYRSQLSILLQYHLLILCLTNRQMDC